MFKWASGPMKYNSIGKLTCFFFQKIRNNVIRKHCIKHQIRWRYKNDKICSVLFYYSLVEEKILLNIVKWKKNHKMIYVNY